MENKTYSEQRKDRLDDVVSDYFSDERISPEQFYMDLKNSIFDWYSYHEENAKKAKKYLKLISSDKKLSVATKKDWTDFWEDY